MADGFSRGWIGLKWRRRKEWRLKRKSDLISWKQLLTSNPQMADYDNISCLRPGKPLGKIIYPTKLKRTHIFSDSDILIPLKLCLQQVIGPIAPDRWSATSLPANALGPWFHDTRRWMREIDGCYLSNKEIYLWIDGWESQPPAASISPWLNKSFWSRNRTTIGWEWKLCIFYINWFYDNR